MKQHDHDRLANQRDGQRLKLARINRGLSPVELCSALGTECRCQQIEDYENGHAAISATDLDKLARLLGLPIKSFTNGHPGMDRLSEWQLLDCYRLLSRGQKRHLTQFVLALAYDMAICDDLVI